MGRFRDINYTKASFWMNPDNQYWEKSALYSEETKEKMRNWLAKKVQGEKSLADLQQPIKNRKV